MKIEKKDKIKLAAVVVVAILAVIVFLQNTEAVETRILLLTVKMSRALLLMLTFLLGLLTGTLVTANFLKKKKEAKT